MRRHTALRSRIIQGKNGVGRAARLERANLLKILALKKQRRRARLIQSRARQHRRPMNVRPNPLMRRADAIKIYRHIYFLTRRSDCESARGAGRAR